MNFDLVDKHKLADIKRDTKQTIEQLNTLSKKMDRQIALLERIVEILKEKRTDADY